MVLGIVSILIFVHILPSIHMHYVYDETPNVGFVNDDNDKKVGIVQENIGVGKNKKDPLGYSLHSMYNRPEKFGTGRRFHSNSRSGAYMVDSQFKSNVLILKATPTSTKTDQRGVKFNIDQIPPRTESPVVEQRKHVEEPAIKGLEAKNYVPNTGYAPYVRDGNGMNAGIPLTKPYSKTPRDHHDPYLINVHKTQVTSGQKVKFNGNQFANMRREDNDVAKSLQKKMEEINKQPKPKYNQNNQKKVERRHYDETDYQKDSVTSSGLDTNMIKLPIGKENFKLDRYGGESVPRIGGWEENVQVKPYALFYRISQDPSKRQFDNVQHFINNDDNEIKDNFADDVLHNLPPVQPTISANSIKLRMKIKKYSNFRSH